MSVNLKLEVAKASLSYINEYEIIGIGTGSTINFFINELKNIKHNIKGAISSSSETKKLLLELKIPVLELTEIDSIPLYIDGADCCNDLCQLIKGKGGALTQEKILATAADKFICIIDETKIQRAFGKDPIPIEVIPMARSQVAKQIIKLQGTPVYRENFITDNGNYILDIYNLVVHSPIALEEKLNNIPGVVESGVFAKRPADIVLIATKNGIIKKTV